MRILAITPYVPYPISGGRIRAYNLLNHLIKFGHDIEIVGCSHPIDAQYVAELEKQWNLRIYMTPFLKINTIGRFKAVLLNNLPSTFESYIKSKIKSFVAERINIFCPDIIFIDDILGYLLVPDLEGSLTILNTHNVEYIRKKRELKCLPITDFNNKITGSFLWKGIRTIELAAANKVNHIFVVSNVDRNIFISENISPNKITVIPNGIDCNLFKHIKDEKNRKNIVFTGSHYFPNIDAVNVYIQNIHPYVKKEFENLKVYLIGNCVQDHIKKYAERDKSIVITGFVPQVKEYIEKASVCIVPIRTGSGTRLKILEYMAMSKPVVSTSIGAEGLEITHMKNIIIADDWNLFAKYIIHLLKNEECATMIGTNARELVESKYDWGIIASEADKVLRGIVKKNNGSEDKCILV